VTGDPVSENAESPFGAPVANPVRPALPAALPPERYYRPTSRGLAALRSAAYFLALIGAVAWLQVAFSTRGAALIGLLYVGGIAWALLRRRRAPAWVKRNDDAVALLAGGKIDQAAVDFEALCRASRSVPHLHSLFVYNRGAAYLRQGEPERALALYSAVLRAGWTRQPILATIHPLLLSDVAAGLVIMAKLDDADWWRRQAHAAYSSARSGKLVLLDAMIELRQSHPREVVSDVHDRWTDAEGALNPPQMKILRLLLAMALTELDAPANAREIQRLLDGAHPFTPGEFDHLLGRWPELERFLARHGFLPGRAERRA
jgi:hypothetical protein